MPGSIDIVIKDGKINIEVDGIEDASCAQLTQALERALGTVEEVTHKPEYYVCLDEMELQAYEGEE